VFGHSIVAAQAFLARYHGDGTILADKRIMSLIPILTVEPKAVNARTLYLMRTPQTQSRLEERLLLTRLAMNARPLPREQAIRNAAADLDVGLLCIQRSRVAQRKRVEETGTFRPSFAVRGYLCFGKR